MISIHVKIILGVFSINAWKVFLRRRHDDFNCLPWAWHSGSVRLWRIRRLHRALLMPPLAMMTLMMMMMNSPRGANHNISISHWWMSLSEIMHFTLLLTQHQQHTLTAAITNCNWLLIWSAAKAASVLTLISNVSDVNSLMTFQMSLNFQGTVVTFPFRLCSPIKCNEHFTFGQFLVSALCFRSVFSVLMLAMWGGLRGPGSARTGCWSLGPRAS